jgi:excisionase family DNA binding protein
MVGGQLVSVRDAAERLGVSDAAIRQQIANGRLQAEKVGRDWLIDPRPLERAARQKARSGRPLSAAMAWAILLLASDNRGAGVEAAGQARYWTRAGAWLDGH